MAPRTTNIIPLRREDLVERDRHLPGIGLLVDEPKGLDWVHPGILVKRTDKIGKGLVALEPIEAGSCVILFGGKLMTRDEVLALPEDMQDIPYQVADDIFFGIPNREDIGVGERINHSCDPNCGFISEMKLVAMRDILPGEDITMDYAMCSWTPDYYLKCQCGSSKCRGAVRGNDWQNLELQERYSGFFQPFLAQKIKALNSVKRSHKMKAFGRVLFNTPRAISRLLS